jgi:amino acid adenylation domain-containing protein
VNRRAEQLERLLAKKGIALADSAGIPRRDRRRPAPLSFAQERLWFLDRLEPGSPLYNVRTTFDFPGALDLSHLAAALDGMADRHEALRTAFPRLAGEPVQQVHEAARVPLVVVDLSALPMARLLAEAARVAGIEGRRPFDLERGPLLRALALRAAGRDRLVVTLHHIVSDGASMGVLRRELRALYRAATLGMEAGLPPLPVQYADFAVWQRERLSGPELARQLDHWRERLAGAPPLLALPTDFPRPTVQRHRGGVRRFAWSAALTDRLRAFSSGRKATLYMVLLAGFQAVLGRHSGEDDVLVGSPVAGRTRPELQGLVGFFVSTLVLRGDLSGAPGLDALLERTRRRVVEAQTHQELPFEKLVEELRPERSLSHAPLFQVMLNLLHQEAEPRAGGAAAAAADAAPPEQGLGGAKYDLTWTVVDDGGPLAGSFSYDADLFDPTTIERLAGHLERFLEAAMAAPELPWTAVPLLGAGERHALVAGWNDTRRPDLLADLVPLHELIVTRARETPDTVAVVGGGRHLSYGALERASAALASRLRGLGAGPETRVAVCGERSPELIVALVAVLRAGAAYVPLDPSYPAERRRFMLEDSGALALLADPAAVADLADDPEAPLRLPVLPLAEASRLPDGPDAPAERAGIDSPLPLEAAPYVIYTSGSTGRPKGVVGCHRGIVQRLLWTDRAYPFRRSDRMLLKASVSFDVSVWELFGPLVAGATLVLAPPEVPREVAALVEVLGRERVTLAHFVPSLLKVFLEAPGVEAATRGLRFVGSSGEALGDDTRRRWYERVEAPLRNQYGPTEASIDVTDFVTAPGPRARRDGDSVRLGRPIGNVRLHVVDALGRPAPIGVPGELWIAGLAVTRGYLGRPALTAERFVPDGFGPGGGAGGARAYRTGDLARVAADGEIEFLGRIDQQVQLRGFRVELGEVATALESCPGVRQAAAAVVDGDRLVGYLVVDPAARPSHGEIRRRLARALPEHMVPPVLVELDALPRTQSGKLDRRALPKPSRSTEPVEGPRDGTETLVASIWTEVLGLDRVGRGETFFELGGHSLLATRVVARLSEAVGVEVPLRALFERPTVAGLAAAVEAAAGAGEAAAPPLSPAPGPGPFPLSFAQERMWFLNRLEPDSPLYNVRASVDFAAAAAADDDDDGEGLALAALGAALTRLAARPESLRTVFPESSGTPRQQVLAPAPVVPAVIDLSLLPAAAARLAAAGATRAEGRAPFDLERGPLWRATVLVGAAGAASGRRLLVSVHHIVTDGVSMEVFRRELAALYRARSTGEVAGEAAALPPLPVSYTDFAVWQRGWLAGEELERQLAAWRERLAGAPPVLALPLDRPRPAVRRHRGARRRQVWSAELADGLRAFARDRGSTLFMVLLAGFQAVVGRHAGTDDVPVGSPVGGRPLASLEGVIGLFVNTLVLRGDLSGAPGFGELLERTRRRVIDAQAHGDLPFEKLVEELSPERSLSHAPLFQVMLNLLHRSDRQSGRPGQPGSSVPETGDGRQGLGVAKFDLTWTVVDGGAGPLASSMGYDADLFDSTTVERLGRHLERFLAAAVRSPDVPWRRLPLLSEAERQALVVERDAVPRAPRLDDATLHGPVLARSRSTPDRVAVVEDGRALTYGGLDRRSAELAGRLRRQGVGPEDRVAVALAPGIDLAVALVAVLRAGAAYLPLDLSYPQERLRFLVEDSAAVAVLAASGEELPFDDVPDLSRVDLTPTSKGAPISPISPISTGAPVFRDAAPEPEAAAYVIYTSGSTGRPKGVVVSHRAVANRIAWASREYDLGPQDRLLQSASTSFDFSVWEIFAALSEGATSVVAPVDERSDLDALGRRMERERVSVGHFVPSALGLFLDRAPALPALRLLFAGGEELPPELARRTVRELAGTAFYNQYGPTEATIDATFHRVGPAVDPVRVSLGRPIDGLRCPVVDPAGRPVPLGVAGELRIGGVGLARGYLGRPALTAERFVPDPFGAEPGGRLYRTGDLARPRVDGGVDFLGRIDTQVQLRGIRIELGEVEAALASSPGVGAAAARVVGERLVGYVVAEPGGVLSDGAADAVLAHASRHLPRHAVPGVVLVLGELPLSPAGKLDRSALPVPERSTAAEGEAPRTEIEQLVASIWGEVLAVGGVGRDDDFFASGGHSLLATRLVARLGEAAGVEVPLRALFEAPTVAGLAMAVADALAAGRPALPPIEPVDRDRRLPLSFAQERMWFLHRLEPTSPLYHVGSSTVFAAADGLYLGALGAALTRLAARHEALRTVFPVRERSAIQRVEAPAPVVPAVVDLTTLPSGRRAPETERAARAFSRAPFDLERGPVWRAAVLSTGDGHHRLVTSFHHIATDGVSMEVFRRELAVLYRARVAGEAAVLPPLPIDYPDFAVWQRAWLSGEELERRLSAWRERLAGAPAVLPLPLDRPRPSVRRHRGAWRRWVWPAELSDRLRAFGHQRGATLFMVLLAGFQAVVGRHAGTDDVSVGSPVTGRPRSSLEGVIGLFVNTLVLRGDLSGAPGFGELLERTRRRVIDAQAHGDLPFEKLVAELAPERSLSHAPLFQVMLNLLHRAAVDQPGGGPDAGVGAAKFDLTWTVVDGGSGPLVGSLAYDADLFDPTTVERLGRHLMLFLEAAVEDPGRPWTTLPLLSPAERHALVRERDAAGWGSAVVPSVFRSLTLHGPVLERARTMPDRVAVVEPGGHLTYGALERRSARLAHRLRKAGVGPENLVAVALPPGIDLVVALLAVLRTGAAYLPLDLSYPEERLRYLVEDSAAVALVAGSGAELPFGDAAGPARVDVAEPPTPGPDFGSTRVDAPLEPDAAAYVIYTSGSTGRPKGVVVPHRGVVHRIAWASRHYDLGPEERILQVASSSFDFSVWEIFAPLAEGAAVVMAPAEERLDLEALGRRVERERVTVAHFVPSVLGSFLDRVPALPALRFLFAGGEELGRDVAERALRTLPGVAFDNQYGPTEASIDVTYHRVRPRADAPRVPLGRTIDGARCTVVDRTGRPAPLGVAGELWIGGVGVTRGYLGRPALTAERFVPDPFGPTPGARVYRTGDLIRTLVDGRLDFLGRIDTQVQLRGIRIELGEVEAALTARPEVERAVAVVHPRAGLVAYLTPADQRAERGETGATPATPAIDGAALRRALARGLPTYMVPSRFIVLDALPLTPASKVDRNALPDPDAEGGAIAAERVAPRTELERALVEVWERVLGRSPIGVDDDFFELGGHSLLGARLLMEVEEATGFGLPMASLFDASTIARQARELLSVDTGAPGAGARGVLVPLRGAADGAQGTPLFCPSPILGDVFPYGTLSHLVASEGPVWALRAVGLEEGEEPLVGIEAMAERCLEEILAVRPAGPYRLLGFSLGGLVAFELARRLTALGETVDGVALVDTGAPLAAQAEPLPADDQVARSFARRYLGVDLGDAARQMDEATILAALSERARLAGLVGDRDPIPRIYQVFRAGLSSMRGYAPEPWAGRLLLFASTDRDLSAQPDLGWRRLADSVDIVPIPASHDFILRTPHVHTVREALIRFWNRAITLQER